MDTPKIKEVTPGEGRKKKKSTERILSYLDNLSTMLLGDLPLH